MGDDDDDGIVMVSALFVLGKKDGFSWRCIVSSWFEYNMYSVEYGWFLIRVKL